MGIFGAPERTLMPDETATGPELGVWDSFVAAFRQNREVDSTLSLEFELQNRWEETVRRYEQRTGQQLGLDFSGPGGNYSRRSLHEQWIQPILDPNQERSAANFFMQSPLQPNVAQEYSGFNERMAAANEAIRALGDPNIKTVEDLLKEVVGAQHEIDAEAGNAGFLSSLAGGVAGNIVSTFSGRDPLSLMMLPVGGFGKTPAVRIATEIAAGMGAEFVAQKTSIQPTRKLTGLPEQSVLAATLVGGAAAGTVRGLFEVPGAVSRYRAGRIEEPLEELSDTAVKEVLEAVQDSPRARAGLELLENHDRAMAANPYGDTETGLRRFEADYNSIRAAMAGQADTAIGRVMPESNLPLDLENLSLDIMTVRDQTPGIYYRVVTAQERLNQLDENIQIAIDRVDNLDIADALVLSTRDLPEADRSTGALLQSYRDELASPGLTTKRRTEIETKVEQIVESSGGRERLVRIADEVKEGGRHDLRSLRASRKAAKKELSKARNSLDEAVKQVQIERRINELRLGKQPARFIEDTRIVNPETVTDAAVEARFAAVASKKFPKEVEKWDALVRGEGEFNPPMLVKNEAGEELIDLGNGRTVSKDFEIPHPTDSGKSIRLTSLLKELEQDVEMINAMKACSL